MSQKILVNKFEWKEDSSSFNEDSEKVRKRKLMKDIFLELTFNFLKNYLNFIMTYHFCQKE